VYNNRSCVIIVHTFNQKYFNCTLIYTTILIKFFYIIIQMIDTLKFLLSSSEVKSANNLVVQPARFLPATGEIIGDFPLFIDTKGQKITGAKAFYNDDKVNVSIFPAYEFLKENKEEQLNFNYSQIIKDSWHGQIFVQVSLPKFLKNSNIESLSKNESMLSIEKLQKYLEKKVGIKTNIFKSNVSRLDVFLNLKTKYNFLNYGCILSGLNLKRKTKFEFAGTTFLFKNKSSQICIYDKIKEQINQGITLNINFNLMRIELRFLKKSKFKYEFGFTDIENVFTSYEVIKKKYKDRINENLFKYDVKELEDNLRLSEKSVSDLLNYFENLSKRFSFDKFIKSLVLNNLSASEIKEIEIYISKIDNRFRKSYLSNKMKKLSFQKILIEKTKDVSNLKLYKEIRDKFQSETEKK